jgi:hypothetical protein
MTLDERREMHEWAEKLERLTRDPEDGWAAMQYQAIGRVMEKLAQYCAVCDCQRKSRENAHQ